MDVIFYAGPGNRKSAEVLKRIRAAAAQAGIVECRSPRELSEALRRPLYEVLAIVLLISSALDLSEIIAFKELLHELRVILVLPGSDHMMVAIGHGLRPRFLAIGDEDLGNVYAVLEKMAGRFGRGSKLKKVKKHKERNSD